jgi:hypothetical protein
MQIRLDHGAEGEEYEEAIEFHTGSGSRSKSIKWRDANSIFVQPILGRKRRYRSVAEALDGLLSRQRVARTDGVATAWATERKLAPGNSRRTFRNAGGSLHESHGKHLLQSGCAPGHHGPRPFRMGSAQG